MDDDNTFVLVNGQKVKTQDVKSNPDLLRYDVRTSERGKTAEELLQHAMEKVCVCHCRFPWAASDQAPGQQAGKLSQLLFVPVKQLLSTRIL